MSRGAFRGKEGFAATSGAAVVLSAVVLSGCYAAVGPSVGINLPDSRPTIGWELSAATFSLGQTFALGAVPPSPQPPPVELPQTQVPSPLPERPWVRRTFLVWEPRIGAVPQNKFLVGGGVTLGGRWDVSPEGTKMDRPRFIGGVFGGGAVPISPRRFELGGRADVYVSIAIGIRGSELYLTPKIGVLQEPEFSLNIGSFN